MMMSDYYDFKDRPADVRSIIALINLQGKDLVGAEIGVFEAESFLTLLQNCPDPSRDLGPFKIVNVLSLSCWIEEKPKA